MEELCDYDSKVMNIIFFLSVLFSITIYAFLFRSTRLYRNILHAVNNMYDTILLS